MAMPKRIKYVAEPTPARFHASDAFVRGIMGPMGSGKSVACVMEILDRARRQTVDLDGRRRSVWGVVRNTYGELQTNTLRTWKEWVPEDQCSIKMSMPIEARMRKRLRDGTELDLTVFFYSLDRDDQVKKFLGAELTGVWLNEARELPKAGLDLLTGRVGRFPPKKDFGLPEESAEIPYWSGIIMDTNPPDTDHWWYHYAELDGWKVELPGELLKLGEWKFWRQPGALKKVDGKWLANPAAENVHHQALGYTYWYRMIAGKDPEWIKAYAGGDYAAVFDGKPVYEDIWNPNWHAADAPLELYRNLPLMLGWDHTGLKPGLVVAQLSPIGQLRQLREYYADYQGLEQFCQTVVAPAFANELPGLPIRGWGDPAGDQGRKANLTTCFDILAQNGFPTEIAPTNKFTTRREDVIHYLTRVVAGKPGYILDPSCTRTRKGFDGGYQFHRTLKIMANREVKYSDEPEKNKFSHVHDALQYLCGGLRRGVAERTQTTGHRPVPPGVGQSTWKGST